MPTTNQNPEQIARDTIDKQLVDAGWAVQKKADLDFNQGAGQAIREYHTDSGPADYVLFVDSKPVGIIEAKKETLGHKIALFGLNKMNHAPIFNNIIPLYSLPEQQEIVRLLDEQFTAIEQNEKEITLTQSLSQSILKKAFEGKLL